jgi:hypothetical protein
MHFLSKGTAQLSKEKGVLCKLNAHCAQQTGPRTKREALPHSWWGNPQRTSSIRPTSLHYFFFGR